MDRKIVIDRAVEMFLEGVRTQSSTAVDEMISYLMKNHSLNSYSLLSLLSSLFSSLSLSMGGKNENDSQSSNACENQPSRIDPYAEVVAAYEDLRNKGWDSAEAIDQVCIDYNLMAHQIYELCLRID